MTIKCTVHGVGFVAPPLNAFEFDCVPREGETIVMDGDNGLPVHCRVSRVTHTPSLVEHGLPITTIFLDTLRDA